MTRTKALKMTPKLFPNATYHLGLRLTPLEGDQVKKLAATLKHKSVGAWHRSVILRELKPVVSQKKSMNGRSVHESCKEPNGSSGRSAKRPGRGDQGKKQPRSTRRRPR